MNTVCSYCNKRQRIDSHPYCGKHCAEKANAQKEIDLQQEDLCKMCHTRRRFPGHEFCSKSCASMACVPVALFLPARVQVGRGILAFDADDEKGTKKSVKKDVKTELPEVYESTFHRQGQAKLDLRNAGETSWHAARKPLREDQDSDSEYHSESDAESNEEYKTAAEDDNAKGANVDSRRSCSKHRHGADNERRDKSDNAEDDCIECGTKCEPVRSLVCSSSCRESARRKFGAVKSKRSKRDLAGW